ncbi:MAG: glycoside hydrolase [Thermoplasmata archaeon]|nr:glycoside hydrolase [Thermoplasmata archaeon]
MAKRAVRVYVGTRKGSYVAESDLARKKWKVRGPYHAGSDVFHVMPDPRHDGVVYSAVNSVFWGPMLYRSSDHGKKWKEIPTPQMGKKADRPPPSFDVDPRTIVRPIVNLWHIEPGVEREPSTVWVGVDPASLYRSDDSGKSWTAMNGINEHATRAKWNPGAGGLCLHSILVDPRIPGRMYIGISAAGTFRSDDSGEHWRPANKGVRVSFSPDHYPEFGQCVHKISLDAANPSTIYRQDHDGIYVSHDAMDSWKRVGRPLPYDFGFVVTSPASRPGTAYFAPLLPMERMMDQNSLQVYRWTEKGRSWTSLLKPGAFPGSYGTHREGMATDSMDPPGIYLGTNTGDVFLSPDEGRHWSALPYRFPPIHSVEVSLSPPAA